jgi:hypothetical protein
VRIQGCNQHGPESFSVIQRHSALGLGGRALYMRSALNKADHQLPVYRDGQILAGQPLKLQSTIELFLRRPGLNWPQFSRHT